MDRDDQVRLACFLALDVLRAEFGDDVPYKDGLDRGFAYGGRRVPFINYQKGIYRAAVQRGPAALSIQTSSKSPYGDEETDEGFLYDYRAGPIDHADNRALRAAFSLGVPIVHFVGIRPSVYQPLYPCYVDQDDPAAGRVLVTMGRMAGRLDEPEVVPLESTVERRYATREVSVRLHQARFRALVVPAYRERCAICRLRELRLLDAAHIIRDLDPRGLPTIANGLSLCSIHHRAYDQDLVGIAPDYRVHVSPRLLDDDDGPMLDVLKTFDHTEIEVPRREAWRPDRARLAERFERFERAA